MVDNLTIGKKQESGLLTYKDWVELVYRDSTGNPVPDLNYTITLADGSTKEGTLDAEGKARIEDIPPGPLSITYST